MKNAHVRYNCHLDKRTLDSIAKSKTTATLNETFKAELFKAEQCYCHQLAKCGTFMKEAQWNLALLALKEGIPEDCKDLLNEYLKSADPTRLTAVSKLLKELR